MMGTPRRERAPHTGTQRDSDRNARAATKRNAERSTKADTGAHPGRIIPSARLTLLLL